MNKEQFKVSLRDGLIWVNNKSFLFENFIYGRVEFIPETHDYPDYVHEKVWQLEKFRHILKLLCSKGLSF